MHISIKVGAIPFLVKEIYYFYFETLKKMPERVL